ncbi:MAG: hypothetical protein PHG31_06535 [Candidatus Omnitrophica bacterium]|nr:hypothetical protein [Candidatus Omnitrophota bacterium]
MRDYIGIFKELNAHGIQYLVAGGVALNLHGVPRMTYDIDLLLNLEEENIIAFLALMETWKFRPKVRVKSADLASPKKRRDWVKKKNMKAFTLVNLSWYISEIEVLIDSPIEFKEAIREAQSLRVKGVRVPLISKKHLIQMKQQSARRQDKSDIELLKAIMP